MTGGLNVPEGESGDRQFKALLLGAVKETGGGNVTSYVKEYAGNDNAGNRKFLDQFDFHRR